MERDTSAVRIGTQRESQRVHIMAVSDPDNRLRWYRPARTYDHAGDRTRAREAMRGAVELQGRE